ncbi:serine/threonine transporter SstT [Campylobacter sp. 19-13652]|uniref:serine/threonine transporter SstT n=1 Tax=Campylobacter sp. 19-13652 TaxID=2840180 RepID=UPI001C862FE3|nr:serine/threonine transporter SstT [Campylobacter sp. 19-13652]
MFMFLAIAKRYSDGNLMIQIIIAMLLGAGLGVFGKIYELNETVALANNLGLLFVGALKAIAPVLIFILILTSIATKQIGAAKGLKKVIIMYLLGTMLAAFVAVGLSFIFPIKLSIAGINSASGSPVQALSEVIRILAFKMVDNPINALASSNFIGVLTWAVAFGVALRGCSHELKTVFSNLSDAVTKIIKFIIRLAPFGIFGLVSFSVYTTGLNSLLEYAKLVVLIVLANAVVALIIYPAMLYAFMRKNPYPLVFTCLKDSGVMAFFTRSSAANVPVNLSLCKKLGLNENLYSISIPLGASINMGGAAITISILALAAVNSIDGISVSFGAALLLSLVSAIGACGASGVASGSLMLVPLACSLFGISNDIALKVVTIGFIISVIQDSVETAVNSASDVMFTAAASMSEKEMA